MKKMTKNLLLIFIGILVSTSMSFAQFNVNISTGATANLSSSTVGNVKTYTPSAANANLQIAQLITDFQGGVSEVRIETGNTGGSQNGDITLSNALNYNGIGLGKTLTLNARNSIIISNGITDGTAGGDLLNLNMTASGLAGVGNGIELNGFFNIQTNGGNLSMNGESTGAGNGVSTPLSVSVRLFTNGGDINIRGFAKATQFGQNNGILMSNGEINAGNGNIIMNGTTNNATPSNIRAYGIFLSLSNNMIAYDVTMNGIGNSETSNGVAISGIAATNNVNITGIGDVGLVTFRTITTGQNITLRSPNSTIFLFDKIESTNGSIEICTGVGEGGIFTAPLVTNNKPIRFNHSGYGSASAQVITDGISTVTASPSTPFLSTAVGNITVSYNFQAIPVTSLSESNLAGNSIRMTINACTEDKFAPILTPADFELRSFPAGTSIQSVSRIDDLNAVITLNYDQSGMLTPITNAQVVGKRTAFNPMIRLNREAITNLLPIGLADFISAPSLSGAIGNKSINLTWNKVPLAASYEVYGYAEGKAQQLMGTTNNTNFNIANLENGITYYFRVVAVTRSGNLRSDFSNTISARPSVVLGTEEETASHLFKVYPNPSNGNFNLVINELKGKNAQISVLDLSGRKVYQQALQTAGSLEAELNLNLANGLYIIHVSTEKENWKRKLVVEK